MPDLTESLSRSILIVLSVKVFTRTRRIITLSHTHPSSDFSWRDLRIDEEEDEPPSISFTTGRS